MKKNGAPPLADVMDLLLDAICVVDAHGHFISVTGACEHIFGYTPEEMVGRQMMDMVFHEDRARTLEAVKRIEAGHLQRHFENRYVRKDGRIVHIMWSARRSETERVRVAVARDITDLGHADPTRATAPVPCWRLSASPPQLIPPGFAPIPLSAQDYRVLLALATGGAAVSREAVVRALGANFFDYDRRRLDTQMRRLRRKVEEACGLRLPVTTLRGIGYRFYDHIEICR
jgi:PAS domain S-box-containing protein